jgi:hypothetical protein
MWPLLLVTASAIPRQSLGSPLVGPTKSGKIGQVQFNAAKHQGRCLIATPDLFRFIIASVSLLIIGLVDQQTAGNAR